MIHPSTFLSRALLADAIFSGVAAVALTLGAGALAPFLNLPEALLRETGLFLIAYTALVGWLGRAVIGAEGAGVARDRGQRRVDAGQHRAAVLRRGVAEPARSGLHRGAGDCDRRVCRAAIYRPAQERRRRDGVRQPRHSGAMRKHRTRNLEIRVWSFGPSRNDARVPQLKTAAAKPDFAAVGARDHFIPSA